MRARMIEGQSRRAAGRQAKSGGKTVARKAPAEDRMFVNALARGLEVLRVFDPSDGALGNNEIAKRTGIPKPTVSRLAWTLTQLGYLIYLPETRRYQLGPAGLSLGYAILARLQIRNIARPLMQQLSDETGASVAVGMRDRLEMLYIAYTHSESSLTLRLNVGTRIPLASTAMGRAFLAGVPETERTYLMQGLERKSPAEWPRLRTRVESALVDVERKGFCASLGEWQRGVNAIAAPLKVRDEIYAISCGAPGYVLKEKRLVEDIAPKFLDIVAAIEDHMLIEGSA